MTQPNDLSAVVAELRRLRAMEQEYGDEDGDYLSALVNHAPALLDAVEEMQRQLVEAEMVNGLVEAQSLAVAQSWKKAQATIAALKQQLAERDAENERLTDANESVAVCRRHATDIAEMSGLANGCWVCEADRVNERIAELERQVPRCCVAEDAVTADQIDNGYGYGESTRITCELHPAPPAEQTGCKRCGKPLAYDGAIYCGAACSAISEMKEGT